MDMFKKKDFSIKNLNTFEIDVKVKIFVEVKTQKELREVLKEYKNEKIFILGGGSNTLFLNDWDGLMIKMEIKGKMVKKEENDYIYIDCNAGEIWDDFVIWTVENNYAGIENMIMIPGTVGGGVAQNIAAYGQNIIDVLFEIEVWDIENEKIKVLKPEDCDFKYRSSKFKKEWKNKFVITKVTFKLKKEAKDLELGYHERAGRYGSLLEELQTFAKEPYSLKDVMQAVINQRTKRLPSVDEYGTCGSFFQNPVVSLKKFKELEKILPDLQSYPVEDLKYNKEKKEQDFVKIPAGRLLDELGWRGKWCCNVGVSEKHALCVVTNKKAKGKDVLEFSEQMKKSVKEKFGVELVEEVNIVV
jgi:UDP-N-acetylmuramate dehydrogenase